MRFLSSLVVVSAVLATGADWRQFRGSDGNGVASTDAIPTPKRSPMAVSRTIKLRTQNVMVGFSFVANLIANDQSIQTTYPVALCSSYQITRYCRTVNSRNATFLKTFLESTVAHRP